MSDQIPPPPAPAKAINWIAVLETIVAALPGILAAFNSPKE